MTDRWGARCRCFCQSFSWLIASLASLFSVFCWATSLSLRSRSARCGFCR